MTIEKVSNGYITMIDNIPASRRVACTTEELFDSLLLTFEERSKHFYREAYAKVSIEWGNKQWPPVPSSTTRKPEKEGYKNKGKDADERYREERKKILEPSVPVSTLEMEESRHKEAV